MECRQVEVVFEHCRRAMSECWRLQLQNAALAIQSHDLQPLVPVISQQQTAFVAIGTDVWRIKFACVISSVCSVRAQVLAGQVIHHDLILSSRAAFDDVILHADGHPAVRGDLEAVSLVPAVTALLEYVHDGSVIRGKPGSVNVAMVNSNTCED